jgi:hypothetical protein
MKTLFGLVLMTIVLSAGCGADISSETNAQNIPDEIIIRTNAYLMQRMSIDYFKEYISLDPQNSAADSPYYQVAYRFRIPGKDFVDEPLKIFTDMDGNVLDSMSIAGVPICVRDTALCSFNIDERSAINIAEKSGLKGSQDKLKTDFKWSTEFNRYVWEIRLIKEESQGSHGYRGSGETVVIDPNSGEVLHKGEWFVR